MAHAMPVGPAPITSTSKWLPLCSIRISFYGMMVKPYHGDGMNKVQVLRRYAPGEEIWDRQVAGCARAVRQYDLDTEISQTCGSKRHRKAGMSLNGSVVIAKELRLLQNH